MEQIGDASPSNFRKSTTAALFQKDASNGLSHHKLRVLRYKCHPYIQVEGESRDLDSKFRRFPVCGTRVGRHSLDPECRASDLSEFGVGLVLYFKFVKYLIAMFFVALLLSVPALILFGSGYMKEMNLDSTSGD